MHSFFLFPLFASLFFFGLVHVSAAVHPRRAIGDICTAPEVGNGTCELKSNCAGISYATGLGLCPDGPGDVEVRPTLTPRLPHFLPPSSSHFHNSFDYFFSPT